MGVLKLDVFDENLKRSLTNYISLNSSEIFKQVFKIIAIYLTMTILIFILLKLVNLRTYDAYNYSLSIFDIILHYFLILINLELLLFYLYYFDMNLILEELQLP